MILILLKNGLTPGRIISKDAFRIVYAESINF